MSQFRIQAPDLQGPVPLNPPPLPNDTYARPAAPPINTDLTRVADALGVFNQSLTRFGSIAANEEQRRQRDIEQQIVNGEIAGKTREQYLDAVQKGELHRSQDPFMRAARDKIAGAYLADRIAEEYQGGIKNGSINLLDPKIDAGTVITQMVNQRLRDYDGQGTPWSLSGSGPAMAGLRTKLNSFREAASKEQALAREAEFASQQKGDAFNLFNGAFDHLSGKPVEELHTRIRDLYGELADTNRKSGPALPKQWLDEQLIEVARRRASDSNTAAAALYVLTAPRKDEKGNPLPPLAANPKYAPQLDAIQTTARSQLSQQYLSDVKKAAADAAEAALTRNDGSFWALTDTIRANPYDRAGEGHEPFTIKAEEARNQAVTQFLNKSSQMGGTPAEQFEREYQTLAGNSVPHPVWKQTLSTSATALTDPASLTDPVRRERAQAAGELFMKLSERNYPYVKQLLGGDKTAMDAWTVYRVLRGTLSLNTDRALDMAAEAVRTPANESDLHVRELRARDVAEAVKNRDWGADLRHFLPGVNATARNTADVQRRVMDIASVLVRVPGIGLDDAVQMSLRAVAERSSIINGHLFPDSGAERGKDSSVIGGATAGAVLGGATGAMGGGAPGAAVGGVLGGVAGGLSSVSSSLPTSTQKPFIERLLKSAFDQHGVEWGVSSHSDLFIMPAAGGNFRIWADDDLGGHPVFVRNKDGKAVPALILGSGDAPNSISRLMKNEREFTAAQTQAASEQSRDSAILYRRDRDLPPEQIARKRELQQEERARVNERVSEFLKASARTPSPRHSRDSLSELKTGALASVELLKRLGVMVGEGLSRLNQTR